MLGASDLRLGDSQHQSEAGDDVAKMMPKLLDNSNQNGAINADLVDEKDL